MPQPVMAAIRALRAGGLVVSVLWSLTTFGTAAPAWAQPEPSPSAAPAFSLKVSPTRLVITPSQAGDAQHFQVANTGRAGVDVDVTTRSLEQHPDGSLSYPPAAPYSAAHWVGMTPRHFHLAPGAARTVTVRLTMPAQPEPGEHAVALLSLVPAEEQHGPVRLNRGVAVPLLVTVPGPVNDTVTLADLYTQGFSPGGPITLTAVVKDSGTVHHDFFAPDHNLLAHAEGHAIAFPDFTVLRGSTRTVTTQWADPPLACICHITVAITREGIPPHALQATVVRFPVYPAGGLIAALATLYLMWRFMASRFTLQRRPQRPPA